MKRKSKADVRKTFAAIADPSNDDLFTAQAAVEAFKDLDLPELCYEPFEISDEVLAELRRWYAPKNPDATTEWL